DQKRERDDHKQATHGFFELVDFAAPLEMGVVGQFDLLQDPLLRFADGRREVTAADREFDRRVTVSVLAIDDRRTIFFDDLRHLAEGDLMVMGSRYGNFADRLDVATIAFEKAYHQIETFFSLVHLGDRLSADRGLDHRLDIAGIEAVTGAN